MLLLTSHRAASAGTTIDSALRPTNAPPSVESSTLSETFGTLSGPEGAGGAPGMARPLPLRPLLEEGLKSAAGREEEGPAPPLALLFPLAVVPAAAAAAVAARASNEAGAPASSSAAARDLCGAFCLRELPVFLLEPRGGGGGREEPPPPRRPEERVGGLADGPSPTFLFPAAMAAALAAAADEDFLGGIFLGLDFLSIVWC